MAASDNPYLNIFVHRQCRGGISEYLSHLVIPVYGVINRENRPKMVKSGIIRGENGDKSRKKRKNRDDESKGYAPKRPRGRPRKVR